MAANNAMMDMFNDTMHILNKGYYKKDGKRVELKLSRAEAEKVTVLLPDEVEAYSHRPDFNPPFSMGGRCGHSCENMDSFMLAMKRDYDNRHLFGKESENILVLNLANPVNPGGGVRKGARAQEEDLCRKSSLLLSLESKAASRYYTYNRSLHTYMGSDALIITPQVEVIKDNNGELLDESFVCAVMTCAAPMIKFGLEGMSESEYKAMVYRRIVGMLKCAAYLGYQCLVLGAWGCGAFGNDARVISDLFYKALKEINYNDRTEASLFNRIDFAVLDRSSDQYNFKEFYRNFDNDNFFRDENQKVIDEAMKRIKETEMHLDKIRGCLIGGAAGDALGYTVEFFSEDSIFSTYGKEGITAYQLDRRTGKALISDDTQMTLFTGNGILFAETRGKLRGIAGPMSSYIRDSYLDWLRTQTMTYEESGWLDREKHNKRVSWLLDVPQLFSLRAPGNTCLCALRNSKHFHPGAVDGISYPINDSKGCGGVMRVAPVALRPFSTDITVTDREGAQIAAITHGHSLGYMPAAVLTHIIRRIVFSEAEINLKDIIIEARDTVAAIFSDDKHIGELTAIIDKAISLSESDDADLDNIHRLGEGWVAEETLAIAVYCALRYQNDFSKGIIAAVNHNGDSDSTGAVTGNILGAIHGYDAIDEKWKENLEIREVIIELADDLCHGCQMSEYGSYTDPDWLRKYVYTQWKDTPKAE